MAFLKVKNRAVSTLASGISDSDLSLTVATGEGALFPTAGDFHVTCEDEIVKCTSRTGDVLTVTRAQEGTGAAAHASGKAVELRITAAIIEALQIQLLDADADTGFEVEQSADEDKIRGKVGGVEAFLLSAVGVLTLAKQSGCAVRQTNVQVIPHNIYTLADFDTEDSDTQDEFNSRRLTGAADQNELNKLHDADGGFEAGDVGATVWNTDDETYGIVTAFVDSGELTLNSDVCPDGDENYVLYHSVFTAKEAGDYLVIGHGQLKQLLNTMFFSTNIYKNGALWLSGGIYSSGDLTYPDVYANDIITLAANDTIKLYYRHNHGGNRETYVATKRCTLGIQKLS